MKIRKAVIAAAGYGTRRLPVTKAIQKELLPYLNKPMIDYIVDACLEAGIEEFIFVVKANSNQISEYYSQNLELEEYLERRGKNEELALVRNLYNKARYTFVPQNQVDGYGTGVPLRLAQSHLENEDAFLYMGGDDIIIRNDGVSFIKLLVDEFEESGADGAATFIRRPWDSLYKYGVAKYREEEGKQILEDL
ncbi:MAG: sugar phosphate nucleotidyltransferase, partial [Candidatus Dojkabacteria bacterium]